MGLTALPLLAAAADPAVGSKRPAAAAGLDTEEGSRANPGLKSGMHGTFDPWSLPWIRYSFVRFDTLQAGTEDEPQLLLLSKQPSDRSLESERPLDHASGYSLCAIAGSIC